MGLHATGGSTNHTMHLIAIAAAAGLQVTWDDMSELSDATPLLARVYPNGVADVNHFHAAGGMGFLIQELLESGHLHEDVKTVWGEGLSGYTVEAKLIENKLTFEPAPAESALPKVLTSARTPFQETGGLKLLTGNLGRSVIKVSAVKPELHVIEAPARVFTDQAQVKAAFQAGKLTIDCIVVLRFQGPRANGMPELHALTPLLSVLLDRGLRVALLTDGRMSGASGKVPAAIHCTPEAAAGGPLAQLRDGDVLRLDAITGTLDCLTPDFANRPAATADLSANEEGLGRELFALFRANASAADEGASVLF